MQEDYVKLLSVEPVEDNFCAVFETCRNGARALAQVVLKPVEGASYLWRATTGERFGTCYFAFGLEITYVACGCGSDYNSILTIVDDACEFGMAWQVVDSSRYVGNAKPYQTIHPIELH